VPVDRHPDDERRARLAELLKETRRLRESSAKARDHARETVARSTELWRRNDLRQRNEALLARAQEALQIAKASGPLDATLPIRQRKNGA